MAMLGRVRQSVEELEEMVVAMFSAVKNKDVHVPEGLEFGEPEFVRLLGRDAKGAHKGRNFFRGQKVHKFKAGHAVRRRIATLFHFQRKRVELYHFQRKIGWPISITF